VNQHRLEPIVDFRESVRSHGNFSMEWASSLGEVHLSMLNEKKTLRIDALET
jgi:hypothetical protein